MDEQGRQILAMLAEGKITADEAEHSQQVAVISHATWQDRFHGDKRILAQERGLWAYIYDGISYDAGDKLGFLKATVELALQNQELGKDFREYLKTLKL